MVLSRAEASQRRKGYAVLEVYVAYLDGREERWEVVGGHLGARNLRVREQGASLLDDIVLE